MRQVRESKGPPPAVRSIVVGHEAKGGGSTTLCLHIAVGLMMQGQQVTTIELDGEKRSLTRALEQRQASAERLGLMLSMPTHVDISDKVASSPFDILEQIVSAVEKMHDFVIVDASGASEAIKRAIYPFADMLLMPFTMPQLDLALDPSADPDLFTSGGFRDIAWKVREARRERRTLDSGTIDWVIFRNRRPLSELDAELPGRLADLSARAALEFGFRGLDGLAERAVYRESLRTGVTIFDRDEELLPRTTPGSRLVSAALEAWSLIENMKMKINTAPSRRRPSPRYPVEMDDIFTP